MESQLEAPKAPLFEHLREDRVRRLVREHMEGRHDHGQQLFCLLTLAQWLTRF